MLNHLNQPSGPNWIHGADNNPMVDLAEETSTAVFPPEEERSSVYDESGQLLSDKKGLEISETVWGIIGEAFKYSNEHSGSIPPEMSLMDFFRNKVDDLKLDEPTAKLVLQMAHIWGDFVGEPIETQSLKYCWLEECIDESENSSNLMFGLNRTDSLKKIYSFLAPTKRSSAILPSQPLNTLTCSSLPRLFPYALANPPLRTRSSPSQQLPMRLLSLTKSS